MNTAKEALHYIVSLIVEDPEAINIDARNDDMGVLLTLRVGYQDMGKVVGKDGQTAKALRSLIRVIGMRENARVSLKIEEPERSSF